ncbi:hypothetical protein [Thermoproteus tenax]|uniref:hypothetical protein n=1 Tax=Thermoproteus tenax TaxID=2271 RepID=UPI00069B707F|nr:hypothetical protein [Thermoproteus tenax]
MRLKIQHNKEEQAAGATDLFNDTSEGLDDIGHKQSADSWALDFIKSLERAPREVLDKLGPEVLEAALREAANLDGDAGVVARLAITLLRRCRG